ncbi:PilX N-terminal domain-containing pilus assembly protein [Trichococcus flocculiformis]|uniref:PilX N-terminal domain-containing pilus assembly protein n=1 Tax=Trichococcus flocculiformis TaxID=82803 RepID=UPI002AAA869C|nr:PilX N-terminal domain-containing pilus assembly protein [Trichococcus flocculiformis]
MGIKHLREENGSGLVLTLMVLLVLSVLGISIGTLTIGSYRLGAANRDATSAYYVAEAGAVTAYDEIQRSVLSAYETNATEGSFYNHVSSIVTSQKGQSSVDFGEQFGTEPTATIATAQNDTNSYTITSTGEVDGKKRTVTKPFTVNWIEKNTGSGGGLPTLPGDAALLTKTSIDISAGVTIDDDIYSDGNIDIPNGNINGNIYTDGEFSMSGGTLNGDIYTNQTENGSIQINGWTNINSAKLFYPDTLTREQAEALASSSLNGSKLPELVPKNNVWDSQLYLSNFQAYINLLDGIKTPDKNHLVTKSDLNITDNTGKYQHKLDSNDYIPKMKVTVYPNKKDKSEKSIFSITTDGQDRTILVDELEITSNNLIVTGGGTLTIVVTNKLNITSIPNFNSIDPENPVNPVNLIYLGKEPVELSNWKGANINANIIIKEAAVSANTTKINGILLTGGSSVVLSGGNADSNMMLIAPKAAVSLMGSYSINGTVIANSFDISGGASLKYADVATTGFPFGSTGTVVDPKPEDIISAGAIIEN